MHIFKRIGYVLLGVILCFILVLRATADPGNKTNVNLKDSPEVITTDFVQPMTLYSSPPESPAEVSVEPIEEDVWEYSISPEEIELIALLTMAEAEGETELGKRLVIDTVLNRVDNQHFPDTVHDVIYQRNQFSPMSNGRIERCYVIPEIVELVKEELLERTNYDCIFFTAEGYSKYGEPMFQECCHYFSSYD